jgi:hypothetical protein
MGLLGDVGCPKTVSAMSSDALSIANVASRFTIPEFLPALFKIM